MKYMIFLNNKEKVKEHLDRVLASYGELLKAARSANGSDKLKEESEEISRAKIPLYCKNKLLIVGLMFILVYEFNILNGKVNILAFL